MYWKRIVLLGMCIVLGCTFCGCTYSGLPLTDIHPTVTLPPPEVSFVAPIGDASLEYQVEATLYLPDRDGIGLVARSAQITHSPVRPYAESLLRALLAQPGDGSAARLGGSTRLSLYGTSPVEVSRNVATVNLSPSALQLSRRELYLACQAITNTLTESGELTHVNILVKDKPVGLDIANTLPFGSLSHNASRDLSAVYDQLISRRVDSDTTAASMPFSADVTLYFPLDNADGMVSETRSMTFDNQLMPEMVTALLHQLAAGPADSSISSPPLPLLADLLLTAPQLLPSEEMGGQILTLDFAPNLDDMLEAYGITRRQSMASICYTMCTFFTNLSGIQVSIKGTPVETVLPTEDAGDAPVAASMSRADFSDLLMDYARLYFADEEQQALTPTLRPVPYRQRTNPRTLLSELSIGPSKADSVQQLKAVCTAAITDTDLLGFSLDGETLLVNLSPTLTGNLSSMTLADERLYTYAIVNTLCAMNPRIKSVCFFEAGSQFDGNPGGIYWRGLFHPLPTLPQ